MVILGIGKKRERNKECSEKKKKKKILEDFVNFFYLY